jgi:hypothetical protein
VSIDDTDAPVAIREAFARHGVLIAHGLKAVPYGR